VGAALTTTGQDGTTRRPGPTKRDGEVYVKKPVVETPQEPHRLKTWWIRAGQQRTLMGQPKSDSETGCNGWRGGHGECLRRSHGEVAGEQLGTYPVNRLCGERGNRRRAPTLSASQAGSGKACRPLMARRRGGGSVVVRGRESRPHGEGTQRVRSSGAGILRGRR
jgi:hypothetical protein